MSNVEIGGNVYFQQQPAVEFHTVSTTATLDNEIIHSQTINCGPSNECVVPVVPAQSAPSPSGVATYTAPPHSISESTVAVPPKSNENNLPFTGADIEQIAVIGTTAVALGVLLMRRRRNAKA